MALDGTSDVAKKRKSDEINQDEETIAAAKLLKVEDQNGSGGTTQSSTEDSDSQHSSSDESTSASQAAGPNPAAPPEVQILIPPAVNVQAQPEQNPVVVELREGFIELCRDVDYDEVEKFDVAPYIPPHLLWSTFYDGWSKDRTKYYLNMLNNEVFSSRCGLCTENQPNDARHFLCQCDYTLETTRRKRHDAILRITERELKLAIKSGSGYLSLANDWKRIVMYNNKRYPFPEELKMLKGLGKYPHLIVYSMFPTKRALVVELKISWEEDFEGKIEEKLDNYMCVKNILEEHGFVVNLEALVFGCRGVVTEEIYNFFKQYFGMNHSKISRILEEISKEIVSSHYKDYINLKKSTV